MIDRIIVKLQKLDEKIKNSEAEAQANRRDGNIERAIFCEGRASGLNQAYAEIRKLVEDTREFEEWEKAYFAEEVVK